MTLQTRCLSVCWRLGLGAILAVLVSVPLSAAFGNDSARIRPERPPRDRVISRQPAHLPQCEQGPLIIPPCPAGTDLVIYDQPVYDDDGIFIVCLEKVPYCIPEGLRPEG